MEERMNFITETAREELERWNNLESGFDSTDELERAINVIKAIYMASIGK